MSSVGDLQRIVDGTFEIVDGRLADILATPTQPHKPHEKLFVFEHIDAFDALLDEFVERIAASRE